MNLELYVKSVMTIVAVSLLLIRKQLPGVELDNVDFALLIAAAFPWLPSIIRSAKLPLGFEFEFNQVKARQEQQASEIAQLIRKEQERQQEEIDFLQLLLINTAISDYGVQHLRNLTAPEPIPYHPSAGLTQDLSRLLESGLIERRPGKGIRTIMRESGDIKDHFQITDLGRRTLTAWERILQERSALG